MAMTLFPNYFFTCPECGKMILASIGFDVDMNQLFPAQCMPPHGCGWKGEIYGTKLHPVP
jgi:hypothetical protein